MRRTIERDPVDGKISPINGRERATLAVGSVRTQNSTYRRKITNKERLTVDHSMSGLW
ncbi:hypothetical protein ABLA76_03985 [Xenorhabdus sp. SGI240]